MHNPVILPMVPIIAIPVVIAVADIVDDAIASVEGQPKPVGPPPLPPHEPAVDSVEGS